MIKCAAVLPLFDSFLLTRIGEKSKPLDSVNPEEMISVLFSQHETSWQQTQIWEAGIATCLLLFLSLDLIEIKKILFRLKKKRKKKTLSNEGQTMVSRKLLVKHDLNYYGYWPQWWTCAQLSPFVGRCAGSCCFSLTVDGATLGSSRHTEIQI